MDVFDHCETLVRAADKDRFFATLFAPQKYRRGLYALYAWNLEIARVREQVRQPLPGEMRLQWWRDAIGGSGQGEAAANPIAIALRDTAVRYGLPPRMFVELIDARTFDLYDDPMPSLDELEEYAARTSSTLMALAMRILNDGREVEPADLSGHAGIAYALTGLLRALPIHTFRGQLFLPLDVLHRHGASAEDVFAGRATDGLRAALAELRLRARSRLAAVRAFVASMPEATGPGLLPIVLVEPTLSRMERRGYDPFRPPELAQWWRQWIFWRAARRGLRNAI